MASRRITALRSVALEVPDLVAAEAFYTNVWRLAVRSRESGVVYLAGSGTDHHLLSLHQANGAPKIKYVTLRSSSLEALDEIAAAAVTQGGKLNRLRETTADASGGVSIQVSDADGRLFEVVFEDQRFTPAEPSAAIKDVPVRLAHTVLNAHDVASAQAFLEAVFDFRLIDRTGIMAFMNCNIDHHSIAFGITDNDALNHIAFLMPDAESVMRGGGRMRDAGHAIEWGPGRHGPGNNTFNYFIDPFGVVIEYTADVEQIDENYPVRMPKDWAWPPGRFDQWGISPPPSTLLKEAQKKVLFVTARSS
jgi:catechol-2,3-dioxygenase